jgi:hypothetical protein
MLSYVPDAPPAQERNEQIRSEKKKIRFTHAPQHKEENRNSCDCITSKTMRVARRARWARQND